MISKKSVAARALAAVLSFALAFPLPAVAGNVAQAPALGVRALGASSIGTLRRSPMPLAMGVGAVKAGGAAAASIPSAAAIPVAANAASPAALPASAVAPAVARHPVIEIINRLETKGVALPESTVSNNDAARLMAAADALPEGPARNNLMQMAHAVRLTASGGSGSALGQTYDNSGAAAAAPEAESLWTRAARWPIIRSTGLAKNFAAKGEAKRVKAQPADKQAFEVPLEKLRWTPAAAKLPENTRKVPLGDKQIVGQDRALKSIYFGLKMRPAHYNLYVSGPDGSGRETAVRHILNVLAPTMETPGDVVAVTNFGSPDEPIILELGAGTAVKFEAGVKKFVKMTQTMLPQVLNSGEAMQLKKQVKAEHEAGVEKRQAEFDGEVAAARILDGKFGIKILISDSEDGLGVQVVPTYKDPASTEMKTVGSHEDLEGLIADGAFTRSEWESAVKEAKQASKPFMDKLEAMVEANNQSAMQANEKIEEINGMIAGQVVQNLAPIILSALDTHRRDTPEHKAWEEDSQKKMESWQAEVAQTRLGGYGIHLELEGGIGVALLKEEGGKMVPLGPEETQAAVAQIGQAEIQRVVGGLIQKLQKINKGIKQAHDKLHEKDPPPAPGMQKAIAYAQTLLQVAAGAYQVFLPHDHGDGKPQADPEDHFRVSVLVDNAKTQGAPVVWERSPSYERLFGSAEDNSRVMLMPGIGAVRGKGPGGPTLRAGSFLKANGGFLVLNVMDVLREPGVWPALMQAVRNGKAEIAEGGLMSVLRQGSDRYEVEAKVKVVLIGSPSIRMLLEHYDEDFVRSFSARAEFEPALNNGEESIAGYLQFMKKVIAQGAGEVIDMTREAVAAVLEFSARVAGSNTKLSAQFGTLYSLMKEATFWAKEAGRSEVRREDIDAALAARAESDGVYQRHFMDLLQQNIFTVETSGEKQGQINGLAVMGSFGVPMRVTSVAVARAGGPLVVSVDQDAKTTGTSFNKALGVVESFLKNTFGREAEIPVQIRISFEQNYGGIDGDSATGTIIYGAISALSELAGVKIKQSLAVTGSADQFGNVQAIGGVNEKVEGYFDLAKHRGLTGEHGVVIPKSNVGDLMLRADIVQAVREGKFHIYAVEHVSQAIEILTGQAYSEVIRQAQQRQVAIRKANSGKK